MSINYHMPRDSSSLTQLLQGLRHQKQWLGLTCCSASASFSGHLQKQFSVSLPCLDAGQGSVQKNTDFHIPHSHVQCKFRAVKDYLDYSIYKILQLPEYFLSILFPTKLLYYHKHYSRSCKITRDLEDIPERPPQFKGTK